MKRQSSRDKRLAFGTRMKMHKPRYYSYIGKNFDADFNMESFEPTWWVIDLTNAHPVVIKHFEHDYYLFKRKKEIVEELLELDKNFDGYKKEYGYEMQKMKKLNQFEVYALERMLYKVFPFLDYSTCGTCTNNMINIQNCWTPQQPNSKFCMLGSYGITEGLDIVLQYCDEDNEQSRKYWLTYRELMDYDYSKNQFSELLKPLF